MNDFFSVIPLTFVLPVNVFMWQFLLNSLQTLYSDTIPEDVLPGKLIMQISATDADIRSNAEITYTLLGSGAEKFKLNPDTGNDGVWDKIVYSNSIIYVGDF